MLIIRKILALVIAGLMSIFVISNNTASYTVQDEENCRLCASVVSDIHIEGNNLTTYKNFKNILRGMKKNTFGYDALITTGDNVMNGQKIESLLFYGLVAQEDPADQYLITAGNHDVGNESSDDSYETLINRFMDYNNALLDADMTKPYYYKVINGYYFIVLAPDDVCVDDYVISDEQFQFLDDTLALATESGKPIFVFNHHPYYYSEDWGEKMESILNKYDNIFYFSGHTHMPLMSWWTYQEEEHFNVINLPRLTEQYDEEDETDVGWGIQLEVYDTEVVCRAINYTTGQFDTNFEHHFKLR